MTTTATVTDTAATAVPGTHRLGKRIRTPVRVTLGELTPNNIGTLRKLNQAIFPVVYSDRFYRDALNPALTPEDFAKLIFYQDLAVGNIVCRLEPFSTPAPTSISTSVAGPPPAPAPPVASSSSKPTPTSATAAAAVAATAKDAAEPMKLYIMTLGVLSAYRRQGLATMLLTHILSAAEATHLPSPSPSSSASRASDPSSPPADKKKKPSNSSAEKEKDKDKKDQDTPAAPARKVVQSVYLHVQVSNDDARQFYEKFGFRVTSTVKDYFRKIEPRDAWVLEKEIKAPATPAAK